MKHFVVQFTNDWVQLCTGKWWTFTFIDIWFERDNLFDGYEFNIGFLGFNLFIRYTTTKGMKAIDNIEKKQFDIEPIICNHCNKEVDCYGE